MSGSFFLLCSDKWLATRIKSKIKEKNAKNLKKHFEENHTSYTTDKCMSNIKWTNSAAMPTV